MSSLIDWANLILSSYQLFYFFFLDISLTLTPLLDDSILYNLLEFYKDTGIYLVLTSVFIDRQSFSFSSVSVYKNLTFFLCSKS